MNFVEALEKLKEGAQVRRKWWPEGSCLRCCIDIKNPEETRYQAKYPNIMREVHPDLPEFFDIECVRNKDFLADDWEEVDS